MTSLKCTREKVYQLFKRNYIMLQNVKSKSTLYKKKVPKSNDYSRCFHLHGVDLKVCESTILKEFETSLKYLSKRRFIELEKHTLLVDKMKRSDIVADPSLLSEMEQREKKIMDSTDDMLRIRTLQLDKLVMLMKEY